MSRPTTGVVVLWALIAVGAWAPAAAGKDLPGVPVRPPAGAAAAAETDRWIKMVREKGDHGGWLVVRGTHVGDQAVAAVTLGTLSHAVVLDKEKEEVIEAVSTGVRVSPLRALLAQAHRVQIVRPRGWTAEAGRAAVARARAHVGRKYDWLGLVAVQDEERFYCTELAVDAYDGRAKGWKVGRVIFPADLAGLGTLAFDSGPRDQPALMEARFARRMEGARGVSYAAEVAPGIYRGGQPDAAGLEWLKSIGVKTVVNLRHFHGDTEGQRVQSLGLRYERLPIESSAAPRAEEVSGFLTLLRDPSLRPIYVHCQHGVDRTGALMAVYRMEEQGWTNAEAFAEMQYFNAHGIWRDLLTFVDKYRPTRPGK